MTALVMRLGYAACLYALLLAFVAACWGFGATALRRHLADTRTGHPLAIALGMGLVICALQALAIGGVLTAWSVAAVTGLGMAAAAWQAIHRRRPEATAKASPFPHRYFWLALLALAALPTLWAPLRLPLAWDELMYHLPQAREWALSGRLQVNEWLRYPWFPYNFDLLFAAALALGSDVLPHLLHACTGWVTAWLIYQLGRQYLQDHAAACLAAAMWLAISRQYYAMAYVDMAVAMFVTAACTALYAWLASGKAAAQRERAWLLAAAFLLGVAAGSKYQVLALIPFFAMAVLAYDRRPQTWLAAALLLVLPCAYWYARNALLTGDPFNPLGGRLFGFSDWNEGDYFWQFEDLRHHAGPPHWLVWPALLAPLVPALRGQRAVRAAMLAAGCMALVWLASSRYPRYLMQAYPLLALLSAAACLHIFRSIHAWMGASLPAAMAWRGTQAILLGALLSIGARSIAKSHEAIAPTAAMRDAYLQQHLEGYGIWRYLRGQPYVKIYQINLEDTLYYAPRPIWGDVFGPWRYRDYASLSPQALHDKLAAEGFTALAVHTGRAADMVEREGFGQYFELVMIDGTVRLYQLRHARSRQ